MEQDVVTGISVPEHGRYTCPGENKHGISKAKKWMGLLQGFSKAQKTANTFEYIKVQVGTFVVLMMPGWMKEYSYKRFLRKSE